MPFPLIPLALTAGKMALQAGSNFLTNRRNRKMADYEFSQQRQMWNEQNQYNTPMAQMSRLNTAGLNPNLVYGSSKVTGNTAGEMPKYQAPRQQMDINPPLLANELQTFQDMSVKDTQKDQMEAQIQNINADTLNKGFDAITKQWAGKISGQEFKRMKNTYGAYLQQTQANAQEQQNRANASNLLETLTRLEASQKAQDLKYGGTRFKYRKMQLRQMRETIEATQLKNAFQVYVNANAKKGVMPGDKMQWRKLGEYLDDPGKLWKDSLNSPLGTKYTGLENRIMWGDHAYKTRMYPNIYNTKEFKW